MQVDLNGNKPIFLQLAEVVEDNILKGIYIEDSQIPSTTEVAVQLKINPATVNKGVNLLVDEGIVYKKRGLGMFVAPNARQKIIAKRRRSFFEKYIFSLLEEATNLGITRDEVITMIERNTNNEHD
ncbi:MAG: GntR family transcriptional regulator [Chloroflexi bacterium HGW-Chloroflexi-10]|nr:MAG: GntR family transcriptional regulator [Chloroflexi bacterium HGW-Chloroflexi-10]